MSCHDCKLLLNYVCYFKVIFGILSSVIVNINLVYIHNIFYIAFRVKTRATSSEQTAEAITT